MIIKNKITSIIFKMTIFLSAFIGILIQSGLLNGNLNISIFNYYTLISNVLCMVYFFIDFIYLIKHKKNIYPKLKGTLTMGITVTGVVYHFMLSKTMFNMGSSLLISNILLHYIVPIFSVLDYILFDEFGNYNKRSPFLWVLIPDLYFLYVIIGVKIGIDFNLYQESRYPYFFIDVDTIGWFNVIKYVIILNILFIIVGYIFVLIDKKMKKLVKN